MRMTLALTLALAAGPGLAATGEDFATAHAIFGQVQPAPIVENLDGEWLPLSTLANLDGAPADPGTIDTYLERFCGNDPARGATLTTLGTSGFSLRMQSGDRTVTYRYEWLGGPEFLRTFDPDDFVAYLGIERAYPDRTEDARAHALRGMSGNVSVFRVSEDILVIAAQSRTEIYGRCTD